VLFRSVMRKVIFLPLIFLAHFALAQDIPVRIKHFEPIEGKPNDPKPAQVLLRPCWGFAVSPVVEEKPKIEINLPFKIENRSLNGGDIIESHAFQVPDGWIVGLSGFECGHWLGWYSKDGERNYKISGHGFYGVKEFYGKYYVFGGARGSSRPRSGFAARLIRRDGVWSIENLVRFPNRVLALSESLGSDPAESLSFLVLTESLIFSWDGKTKKDLLYGSFGFDSNIERWAAYKPNSIIEYFDKGFYIGTDHGVFAVLRFREPSLTFVQEKQYPVPATDEK